MVWGCALSALSLKSIGSGGGEKRGKELGVKLADSGTGRPHGFLAWEGEGSKRAGGPHSVIQNAKLVKKSFGKTREQTRGPPKVMTPSVVLELVVGL